MATRDPDSTIVALFKHHAVKNEGRSVKEGRPIYDDMEICEIRFAGSRNVSVFPALAFSHWGNDDATQEQVAITYAERFPRQYRQFKEHTMQTKSGTPLTHVPFLTEARRAELRALNIYTAEALAHVDGQELKNLGSYGRDLKNKAIEFIADAKLGAPTAEVMAELEALRARNQVLEEDAKAIADMSDKDAEKTGGPFDHMTAEMLRDFIKTNTGHAPHGSLNRKTLVRMANEAQQKVA
jgi:hypothetical protein